MLGIIAAAQQQFGAQILKISAQGRQRGIEKAPSPGIQPKRFEALIVERRVTASFRRVPSSAVHVFVGNEGLGQRLRTIDVHHRSPR